MYNYLNAMKADILEAIRNDYTLADYENRDELEERLNDELWMDDSVTGNASGSYTFSRCQAWEYVSDNMDLLREAVTEFCEMETLADHFMNEDYEWMDVTIRCYLLGQAISEALDEFGDDEYAGEDEPEIESAAV